jgi:hypothetical protein
LADVVIVFSLWLLDFCDKLEAIFANGRLQSTTTAVAVDDLFRILGCVELIIDLRHLANLLEFANLVKRFKATLAISDPKSFCKLLVRRISQHLTTAVAHHLQQLLDFSNETDVKDRHGKLNVAKVPRTDLRILITRCAEVVAIDGAKAGVTKAILARAMGLFILSKVSSGFIVDAT